MREVLTLTDREKISRGLAAGWRLCDIAEVLGRDRSVISREVARHGGREDYRAGPAEEAARAARARPKRFAVDRSPRLQAVVTGLLKIGWSPASIAGRLDVVSEVVGPVLPVTAGLAASADGRASCV